MFRILKSKKWLLLLFLVVIAGTACDPVLFYSNFLAKVDYHFLTKDHTIRSYQIFLKQHPYFELNADVKMDLDWMIREHNRVYLANVRHPKNVAVYIEMYDGNKRDVIAEDVIVRYLLKNFRLFSQRTNLHFTRVNKVKPYITSSDMFVLVRINKKERSQDAKVEFSIYFPQLTFSNTPYFDLSSKYTIDSGHYSDFAGQIMKSDIGGKLKTMLYILSGRVEEILPDMLVDFSDFTFTRFLVESGNPWLIKAIINTGDEDLISKTLYRYPDILAVRDAIFTYTYRWDGISFLAQKPYLFASFTAEQKAAVFNLFLQYVVSSPEQLYFSDILNEAQGIKLSDSDRRLIKKIIQKYAGLAEEKPYSFQQRQLSDLLSKQ